MTAPGRRRGPAPGPGTTLLVIAKEPVPGRVKTRLVPPCTPRQAAALAEAALADTLHAVLAAPARRRVLVLDGEPGPWLPPGFDVVPQCRGGLDERLAAIAAAAVFSRRIPISWPGQPPGLVRLLEGDLYVLCGLAVLAGTAMALIRERVQTARRPAEMASGMAPGTHHGPCSKKIRRLLARRTQAPRHHLP